MAQKHKIPITKLAVFVLVVAGFSLLLSGGKVSAVTCPGSINDIPSNWGVQEAGLANHFASVVVYAYSAKDGQPLNVNYRLNSNVNPDYSYPPAPPGVPNSLYPEHRIFKVHIEDGQITTDARYKQRWFKTGETLSSPSSSCKGWDLLGPGTSSYNGNGFMLDCQEVDTSGQKRNNRFWIDQISNPTGSAGEWGGHWTVKTSTGGGAFSGDRNVPMNGNDNYFAVKNGENARVHLIWHPNDRPDEPPPPENDCTFTKVTGSKFNRRKVEVSRISGGDKFYDGSPDGTHGGNIDAWVPSPPGEEVDGEHTKRWNYKARDRTIHIKITQSEWKDNTADGVANPHWVDTVLRDDDVVCYDATCDLSVTGNVLGRPSGVEYGSQFTVNAHVYNRADPPNSTPLWAKVDDRPLILAENDGSPVNFWYNPGAPDGLGKKHHSNQTWNVTEPGWNIGHYDIDAKLYYDFDPAAGIQSGDFVVADCSSASYDVYKEFQLEPSASSMTLYYNSAEDYEDPNKVVMAGSINNDIQDYREAKMTANATGTFNKNGADFFSQSKTYNNLGFKPVEFEAPVSNPKLGDRYCGRIRVSPYLGWQGPSDRVDIQSSKTVESPCADIVNHPYVRVYGNDVVAGSNFVGEDEECNANSRQIKSYTSSHADKSGAGAQLAAVAMDTIDQFRTASLRTSNPRAPIGLSFGNDSSPTGHYSGEPLCSTDFYEETQSEDPDKKNTVSSSPISLSSTGSYYSSYDQTLVTNGADNNFKLTLNGANNFDDKKIIYVDGDVTITSNIAYHPFSDPNAAPAFMLVARGNIYIERGVTRLDGIYVAQQKPDTSGGTIFTCAKPGQFSEYNTTEMFNNCGGPQGEGTAPGNRQLTVNGAFIANDIRLHRVHKSVRDSRSDIQETTGVTQASEIFNFSPEMYISQPPFSTDSSATTRFQYYTTLPPVL